MFIIHARIVLTGNLIHVWIHVWIHVCDGHDPSVSLAYRSFSFIATAFVMSNTCSSDYEIMQLPDIGGMPCVLSNITTQMGDYKDDLQVYLRTCLLGWH